MKNDANCKYSAFTSNRDEKIFDIKYINKEQSIDVANKSLNTFLLKILIEVNLFFFLNPAMNLIDAVSKPNLAIKEKILKIIRANTKFPRPFAPNK